MCFTLTGVVSPFACYFILDLLVSGVYSSEVPYVFSYENMDQEWVSIYCKATQKPLRNFTSYTPCDLHLEFLEPVLQILHNFKSFLLIVYILPTPTEVIALTLWPVIYRSLWISNDIILSLQNVLQKNECSLSLWTTLETTVQRCARLGTTTHCSLLLP